MKKLIFGACLLLAGVHLEGATANNSNLNSFSLDGGAKITETALNGTESEFKVDQVPSNHALILSVTSSIPITAPITAVNSNTNNNSATTLNFLFNSFYQIRIDAGESKFYYIQNISTTPNSSKEFQKSIKAKNGEMINFEYDDNNVNKLRLVYGKLNNEANNPPSAIITVSRAFFDEICKKLADGSLAANPMQSVTIEDNKWPDQAKTQSSRLDSNNYSVTFYQGFDLNANHQKSTTTKKITNADVIKDWIIKNPNTPLQISDEAKATISGKNITIKRSINRSVRLSKDNITGANVLTISLTENEKKDIQNANSVDPNNPKNNPLLTETTTDLVPSYDANGMILMNPNYGFSYYTPLKA